MTKRKDYLLTDASVKGIAKQPTPDKVTRHSDGNSLYLIQHPNGSLFWQISYRYQSDKAKALSQSIELAKLRRAQSLTQSELAALMGVSQACISKVESGKDIQLSTLQNYIRALGGEVSIIAKLPNRDVILI